MKIAFPCESCGYRFEVDGSPGGEEMQVQAVRPCLPDPRASADDPGIGETVKTFGAPVLPVPPRPDPLTPPTGLDPYYDDDPYAPRRVFHSRFAQRPSRTRMRNFSPRGPETGRVPDRQEKEETLPTHRRSSRPLRVVKIGGGLTLVSAPVCCSASRLASSWWASSISQRP